jgi:hypothetical protein
MIPLDVTASAPLDDRLRGRPRVVGVDGPLDRREFGAADRDLDLSARLFESRAEEDVGIVEDLSGL